MAEKSKNDSAQQYEPIESKRRMEAALRGARIVGHQPRNAQAATQPKRKATAPKSA